MINKKTEEKVTLEDYLVDEAKFLVAINNGEVFLTAHSNVGSHKQGGSVYFRQEFLYRFDSEFIKNNEELLLKLGIITRKRKRR